MGYQNYAGAWLTQSNGAYDWLSNPTAQVSLGGGIDTVKIWQSYVLPANANNLVVFGDGNYAEGNAGNNVLVADAARVSLYGGLGGDVFVGSGGSGTTFIIAQGEGDKVIQNFSEGADTVRLIGGPLTSFSALQAAMTQQGSDVTLNDGGTMILFRNASVSQFQAKDFVLPLSYASLGAPAFSDDFNSAAIGTKWVDNFGYAGLGLNSFTLSHNAEQEIYTGPGFQGTSSVPIGLNPFSYNNGILTITAQPVTAAQSAQMWGYSYSSGMLESNYAQTYGYFEMRAQLPQGQGLWPAFWLLGPQQKEIDILEGLGSDTRTVYNAVHSLDVPSLGNASFNPYATGFHTYGMMWDPVHITYYVDGSPVWQTATPADMNSPMRLVVNLAVGGNWPGSPDATTPWPAQMQIDYVRAYNLPGSASSTSTASTSTSSSLAANLVQYAGAGSVLTGTSGADTFLFQAAPWTPATVTNFQPGVDHLNLTALFAAGYAGTDPIADGHVLVTTDGAGGTKVLVNPDGPHSGVWPQYVADLQGVSPTGLTSAALFGGPSSAPIASTTSANTILAPNGYGTTMTGGAAADTFVFKATPWTPATITGFQAGVDHLDLSALYASHYAGSDPVANGYALFISDGAGGTDVLVDADGPNAGAWPAFIVDLKGVSPTGLTSAEVLVSTSPAAPASAPTAASGAAMTLTATTPGSTLVGGAGNDAFYASQGPDVLTGGGGSDAFVFQKEPWAPATITDFQPANDVINLKGLFQAIGYSGANPVADHYLTLQSDGAGGAQILFDPQPNLAGRWPDYIIHLEHVAPTSLQLSDFVWR